MRLVIPSLLPLVVSVGVLAPCSAQTPRTREAQRTTTICELVAKSASFNGKLVRVAAALESDGMHMTLLKDSRCSLGVQVLDSGQSSTTSQESAGIAALDRALSMGMAGTLDKKITGVFIGRFVYARKPGSVVRAIELHDVADLKVTKLKQ